MPHTHAGQHAAVLVSDVVESGACTLALALGRGQSDEYAISGADIREIAPAPDQAGASAQDASPRDAPKTRARNSYFARKPIFKMDCEVTDVSVLDVLPEKMLGPQTDYGDIHVNILHAGKIVARLLANVTNSVLLRQPEGPSVHLGLVVLGVVGAATNDPIEPAALRDLVLGKRPVA